MDHPAKTPLYETGSPELGIICRPPARFAPVLIGDPLPLPETIRHYLPSGTDRVAAVCSMRALSHHRAKIESCLEALEIPADIFCIEDGEVHKTRTQKALLENKLFHKGHGKRSVILGIGGGTVTDLAGFVAATWCRGVPFIPIPTTLMAMVDASIGGKTGVNARGAKNRIGAFHLPIAVLIDPSFLATLEESEYRNGMAEVIKHALIASEKLFVFLETHVSQIRSSEFLLHVLTMSSTIKCEIVSKDFFETGWRRVLNFGHTIAHALEAGSRYRVPHGEAVAIGIGAESWISHALGLLARADYARITECLRMYRFPRHTPPAFASFLHIAHRDKKNAHGHIHCVTLDTIGTATHHGGEYCTPIHDTLLQQAWEQLGEYGLT